MNYLYIIPFVCAVQTAEHNSAHLKWKIKSCQTIASNLLLHTKQWQFIVTKKHHFLTVPYILFKILTLLRCFIENFHEGILHCRRIATVKRIWVHNILLVEAVDHCSAHCSPAIPPLYHYWLFSVWRLDFICKKYLKAKDMSRSCYSKIKSLRFPVLILWKVGRASK